MLPHHTANRIEIATAAEVASRIPSRRDGAGYRTRGYCHGSGDKPDSASLIFSDPKQAGASLHVHCFKCNAQTPAEYDAIRHALQKATGLQLCRCPQCWQESGTGHRRQHPHSKQAQTAPERRDTAELVGEFWTQAQMSTGAAPSHHPVMQWIERHRVWPLDQPLPIAVRWLPRSKMPPGRRGTDAAGALVLGMWPLDQGINPAVHKVQLIAIDANGAKTQHWSGKTGDKRTYGQGPGYGLLFHAQPEFENAYQLHAVEGLKDGLNLLQALPADAGHIVAVCAGTSYRGINPLWFKSVTLWPDGDHAGINAAKKVAIHWLEQYGPDLDVTIKKLQPGQDPGAIDWRSPQ